MKVILRNLVPIWNLFNRWAYLNGVLILTLKIKKGTPFCKDAFFFSKFYFEILNDIPIISYDIDALVRINKMSNLLTKPILAFMNLGIQITHLRKRERKIERERRNNEIEKESWCKKNSSSFWHQFWNFAYILYYTHNLTSITLRKILCILQKNT